jgi:hypothetical protein
MGQLTHQTYRVTLINYDCAKYCNPDYINHMKLDQYYLSNFNLTHYCYNVY